MRTTLSPTFSKPLPPFDGRRLKALLDEWADRYNRPAFIEDDPISVPHRFTKKQDVEISAFFAATMAWGQRKTIVKNSLRLMELMDNAPHDFMLNHRSKDLKRFLHFRHRTFQPDDVLYFIDFFRRYYKKHDSLEEAFSRHLKAGEPHTGPALDGFHQEFFSLPNAPARTRKHVAAPSRHSACKRLNMFLRWMVRNDDRGVDFGWWKNISPAQLLCPIDVHTARTAHKLGLLERKILDWKAALELTEQLREFNPADPVKYDFALFGWSVNQLAE